MLIELKGEKLELLLDKAIYWEKEKALIISDLHFGKVMHFCKAGIPVPPQAIIGNWERFTTLLALKPITRIILLGDLFHSYRNNEWEMFEEIVHSYRDFEFELVLGNHDISPRINYQKMSLKTFYERILGPFIFTHEPMKETRNGYYNLCGHIHPGIRLRGKGRQTLKLPCFYFGAERGILPAFGLFTGIGLIEPSKEDRVYVITDQKIIRI